MKASSPEILDQDGEEVMTLEPSVTAFPFEILPEAICGNPELVTVSPNTSPPYSFIAALKITSDKGKQYLGTAFEIFLPHVPRRVLVTSGHNTFIHDDGGRPKQIEVNFPGQPPIIATGEQLQASPGWINTSSEADDYGAILLPGESQGFGWAILPDDELTDRLVSISGYNPITTQLTTGGPITATTAKQIFYMNDSLQGMSGSPIWTWEGGFWKCVGVHSYGNCPNAATRFTLEVVNQILQWAGYLWFNKAIGSTAFTNVFLRMNGSGVTQHLTTGGGIVNCQFGHLDFEAFDIIPVGMAPSLAINAGQKTIPFAVRSREFGTFLRMDGSEVTQFVVGGSGTVNCQFDVGTSEVFNFVPRGEQFFIRSVQFRQANLRMDGSGVSVGTANGGGKVNCQFGVRAAEVFKIV